MLSITKAKLLLALRKAAVIIILYFIQTLFTCVPILGVVPIILPAAGAAVALFADGEWSAGWGMFAGLLCDISVGGATMQFTILMTVIGLAAGFLSIFYLTKSLPTYIIIAVFSNISSVLVQLIAPIFFNGINLSELLPAALVQLLYSSAFIVPIYYFARRFSQPKYNEK